MTAIIVHDAPCDCHHAITSCWHSLVNSSSLTRGSHVVMARCAVEFSLVSVGVRAVPPRGC